MMHSVRSVECHQVESSPLDIALIKSQIDDRSSAERGLCVGRNASSIPVVVMPINLDATLERKTSHATENLE